MTITLPKKFDEILTGKYRAFVDAAISKLNDIYKENRMDFFQEYTDHGANHIEEVLMTAENLIDEDSLQLLNEKDISVLITAVLLHDLGMHISREGVKKLFDSSFDNYRVRFFDNKSWKEEWVNYFQEAKRFNDEQLKNIFGTTTQNLSEPDLDNLDDYTRKLYGEFLRRHHHRLAHEIAIGGFPTLIGSENIKINSEDIERDIVDLAGLVARSHGMPVRMAIDYLEEKFQDAWRTPYNIKSVFLMIVLRISDYLQIHSERASKVLLKSKRFSSPISKMEWEKHNAVKDINIRTADPERIFVIANPENSIIYLELEALFQDIQSELDISWAILGEAYGKDEELRNLKIKYRRIRSVLDDKNEFEKKVSYIPEKVFFNADPSLLKLLIGPLYGEDPKYGVRELLQNSIDAIKEREYISSVQGKVTITIQPIKKGKTRYELIIKDSGIGMSKDTIVNYFFKAGASFRKSMSWKKNFVDDNEVKIQKTGRFGVGVLAVFLLGDEFELWTKYETLNSQGYYCKASLSMTQVELQKIDCEIGTAVKILLKESVNSLINSTLKAIENAENNTYKNPKDAHLLEWFTWYLMDRPKIEYNIDGNLRKIFKFIDTSLMISSVPDAPSPEWRSFVLKDYRSVHWTIDLKYTQPYLYYNMLDTDESSSNQLVCNGFVVNRGYNLKNKTYDWRKPRISVFDNNAHFPLSLNRDYIQEDHLPFENEIFEHIVIEIINTILKTEFVQIGPYFLPKPNYLSLQGQMDISDFIIVIGDEFSIMTPMVFSILGITDFIQFWFKNHTSKQKFNFIPKVYQASLMQSDSISYYKQILEPSTYNYDNFLHWFNLKSGALRNDPFSQSYISTFKLEYLLQNKRMSQYYKDMHNFKKLNNKWSQITSAPSEVSKPKMSIGSINSEIYPLIIKRFTNAKIEDNNFLKQTWHKYLGKELTFPIEMNKRPETIKFKE